MTVPTYPHSVPTVPTWAGTPAAAENSAFQASVPTVPTYNNIINNTKPHSTTAIHHNAHRKVGGNGRTGLSETRRKQRQNAVPTYLFQPQTVPTPKITLTPRQLTAVTALFFLTSIGALLLAWYFRRQNQRQGI